MEVCVAGDHICTSPAVTTVLLCSAGSQIIQWFYFYFIFMCLVPHGAQQKSNEVTGSVSLWCFGTVGRSNPALSIFRFIMPTNEVYSPTTASNPKLSWFLIPSEHLDQTRFRIKLCEVVSSTMSFTLVFSRLS